MKRYTTCSLRKRLPIVPDILKLKQVLQPSPESCDTSMLWAAACMCFFGSLRVGEVVSSAEAPVLDLSFFFQMVSTYITDRGAVCGGNTKKTRYCSNRLIKLCRSQFPATTAAKQGLQDSMIKTLG